MPAVKSRVPMYGNERKFAVVRKDQIKRVYVLSIHIFNSSLMLPYQAKGWPNMITLRDIVYLRLLVLFTNGCLMMIVLVDKVSRSYYNRDFQKQLRSLNHMSQIVYLHVRREPPFSLIWYIIFINKNRPQNKAISNGSSSNEYIPHL